ncbi:MAG: hypothetical protein ACKVU4_08525 [Phycisphaerales bacterium]
MGSRFTISPPRDFVLARDYCSYGYFLLWPNRWDPKSRAFSRVLDLADGPATLAVRQEGDNGRIGSGRGRALLIMADRGLNRAERAEATRLLARMLRLDEDHGVIRGFHKADPRYRRSGRGRLMRSPTMFEDVIKTVTSCNVTWPSTVTMNRRLCEVVGRGGAFPDARRLARARAGTLRARCRVGYRDARIIELSRMFASGELDAAWFEDPATSDDAVHDALVELPGIGPYAAANIMQLLGRYSRLPVDTETVRHAKLVLGFRGPTRRIMKAVHRHYAPFGTHAFRSYWLELWDFYESKRGPAWTWDRDTTGATFTASQF